MRRFQISFASKVAMIYIMTSGVYILFSDRLLALFSSDPVYITQMQSFKAWGFILVTGTILFLLLGRESQTRSQAQDEYQNIFEHAAEGIFQSTPGGRFVRVNRAMAKIFGYADPEQMVDEISDISRQIYVHAEEREEFSELLLRDGVVEGFIGHNLRRDGSIISTSTTARVARDMQGNVRYYEGFIQDISKQKQAEEALLAAESRYRALVEQIPAVVYIDSPDVDENSLGGPTLYISPQIQVMVGYSPEEWIAEPSLWINIVHPADQERVLKDYHHAQQTGEPLDSEYRMIARDGHIVWVQDRALLVTFPIAQFNIWQGVIIDISERKQSDRIQDAIYQIARAAISTRTLDELYEFIHLTLAGILPAENFYIALYDPTSDLLTFPYFIDQLDEPSAPMPPGRGLTEYVLRTEKPLLATPEVFTELLERGEVERIGVDLIDWLGVPLRIEDRTIGVMVIQSYVEGTRYREAERDILSFVSYQVALAIERKRAESALVESERRFRRLVDFSPQPIAVHSDGEILYANPSLLRLIAADSTLDVIGKPVLDFIHPDFRPVVVQRIQDATVRAMPLPVQEEKFIRLDGKIIDVEVVSMAFMYDGKPAIQSIIQDITERKLAHDALQRQLKEMTALNAVAAVATKSIDLDELIAQATQVISDMLYPDNCGIVIVNPVERTWRPHPSYHGISAEKLKKYYPLGVGISGISAETGNIIRIGDIRKHPEYMEATPGILSEISVPILVNGSVYGVVNAESRQMDDFSEQDVRLLTTIADSLATAIEKIRLLNTEKERLREFRNPARSLCRPDRSFGFEKPSGDHPGLYGQDRSL